MANSKTGIVLEGGGMRGMYTCGILDVLMENQIYLDGMVGVSAGIAFGCNYKSGQPGRALRYNKRFAKDRRYSGLLSLIKTGNYYNAEFAYKLVPTHYDVFDANVFETSPMECYAVCFDVNTGEGVYQQLERVNNDTFEWIRASASMPVVAKPVEVGGRFLLDGGLADSIPLEFMMSKGYGRNVVILTREEGYRKTSEHGMWLMKPLLRKYPKVIEALIKRPGHYNMQLQQVREQERKGTAFVFRPMKPLDVSRTTHDANEMERVYQQGRKEALQRLDELKKFLAGDDGKTTAENTDE
ncbi:MAG: patatin family protein [Muribaculaceae bacterium]|nr:patatin family protein [Muribaculaceae bacterium]MBQ7204514.1 patatin family protein [Muribaculaceae bacterium]